MATKEKGDNVKDEERSLTKRKQVDGDDKRVTLTKKRKKEKNKKDKGAVKRGGDASEHKGKKGGKQANKAKFGSSKDQPSKDSDDKPKEKGEVWSKSKKKRMRLLKAKMNKKDEGNLNSNNSPGDKERKDNDTFKKDEAAKNKVAASQGKGSSSLQKSYAARLTGSRFRILNEELYTTTSETAFERFQSNPELFDQYHEGFRHQVESWPSNPVDVMLRWLNNKYANGKEQTVVADFGCGDAELAKRLLRVQSGDDSNKNNSKESPFKVHSFDLVAQSDLVTACDMANVPLKDKTVDVAIFCLALMGTNVTDFLVEAHRVLKEDGRVKVAEVRSRFESASGKDSLDDFVKQLKVLGFKCEKVDRSNKMFILMELRKNGKEPDRKMDVKIKPCIYKRR